MDPFGAHGPRRFGQWSFADVGPKVGFFRVGDGPVQEPGEYELRVDEHVASFIAQRQKLVYFIVAAAVAIVAFLADFIFEVLGRDELRGTLLLLLVSAGATAVLSAASALSHLLLDNLLARKHYLYRYEHKTFASLTPEQRTLWAAQKRAANWLLVVAFASLGIEVSLAVILCVFVISS